MLKKLGNAFCADLLKAQMEYSFGDLWKKIIKVKVSSTARWMFVLVVNCFKSILSLV